MTRTTLRATDARAIARVRNHARRFRDAVRVLPDTARAALPDYVVRDMARTAEDADTLVGDLTDFLNGWSDDR